jgi:hypothetical protein
MARAMITITETIPVPLIKIDNVPLPAEQSKHRMDRGLKAIVARFAEAYKRVYGVTPTVQYTKPWLQVSGTEHRVSRQRLLEMAKQLEYRAG